SSVTKLLKGRISGMQVKVIIRYEDKKIQMKTEKGTNLLQLLYVNDIPIPSPCGGNGSCGKCRVKVNTGRGGISAADLNLLTEQEVERGYRLACRTVIEDDMEIEILKEEGLQILTDTMDRLIKFHPQKRPVRLYSDKRRDAGKKAFG